MIPSNYADLLVDQDIAEILPLLPGNVSQGARFFITGGTGFVGVWLVKTLLALSDARNLDLDLTLLTRSAGRFIENHPNVANRVHLLEGDIMEFPFPRGAFTYVIHAATETNAVLNEANPLSLFDSIVWGTRRILDFCVTCHCQKMLYISSGAVYGTQPSDLEFLKEDYFGAVDVTLASGFSAYSEGKRGAEALCALFGRQSGVAVSIARLFTFVGPYLPLDGQFAVGNFIKDALSGRDISIRSDGTSIRSYMYGADMAYWVLALLFLGKNGSAYNIGSNEEISIKALAERIANISSYNIKASILGVTSNKSTSRYVPSIEKISGDLGVSRCNSLNRSLKKTMRWNQVLFDIV